MDNVCWQRWLCKQATTARQCYTSNAAHLIKSNKAASRCAASAWAFCWCSSNAHSQRRPRRAAGDHRWYRNLHFWLLTPVFKPLVVAWVRRVVMVNLCTPRPLGPSSRGSKQLLWSSEASHECMEPAFLQIPLMICSSFTWWFTQHAMKGQVRSFNLRTGYYCIFGCSFCMVFGCFWVFLWIQLWVTPLVALFYKAFTTHFSCFIYIMADCCQEFLNYILSSPNVGADVQHFNCWEGSG